MGMPNSPFMKDTAFVYGFIAEKHTGTQPPPKAAETWGQVLVKLDGETATAWARMVLPYISSKNGFEFYPEVGSRVICVQFPTGELLCLGCVHSATIKTKVKTFEGKAYWKNTVKEISTDSGHYLRFTEDEKGKKSSVELHSIGKAKMFILMDSEKKEFTIDAGAAAKVKITAKSADMTVEAKNATVKMDKAIITVKAGKVTIKADAGISIDSKGKVEIKGSQIDLKAPKVNIA